MATSLKDKLKWSHLDAPRNPDFDRFSFASRRSVVWGSASTRFPTAVCLPLTSVRNHPVQPRALSLPHSLWRTKRASKSCARVETRLTRL